MTIGRRFLGWTLYSMVFFASWMLVEGGYVAWISPGVPLWSWPLNLGVAALPVVLGAGCFGGVLVSWSRLLGCDEPVSAGLGGIRAWLLEGAEEQLQRRSAWILGCVILGAVWFGVGVWVGTQVFHVVKTQVFAIVMFSVIVSLMALGFALLAPLVVLVLEFGVGVVLRPIRRVVGRNLLTPVNLLVLFAIIAGYAVVGLWLGFPHLIAFLPWVFVVGPLAGFISAYLVSKVVGGNLRWQRLAVAVVGGLTLFLGILSAYMPLGWKGARHLFVGQTSVASAWYSVVERVLDYDGDGAIHLYAGGDCAPFDAARGPNVLEIINNGIDENCSGSDLTTDPQNLRVGTQRHPRPEGMIARPNIIMITTDSLSQSHTSLGGYRRDTTPNLKRWAERATVFEHGFSLSSGTRQSFPGLFASNFLSTIALENRYEDPFPYGEGTATTAKLLRSKEHDYETVFVASSIAFDRGGWPGKSLGFEVIDVNAMRDSDDAHHTAPAVTARALHHLRTRDRERPLFLWVHYYDHHEPYRTPAGHRVFEGTGAVDDYDNALHWADKYWDEVIREVESTWKPEEYIMVFTADHGEVFGENDKPFYHNKGVGTESVHVPLVIQGPKQRGARVEGLASHADIPVTLMNLVDIEVPGSWIGESLVPVLFDGADIEKTVLYGLYYSPEAAKLNQDSFWDISVRMDEFLYLEDLRTGSRKLVDWKNDRLDAEDLSGRYPGEFELYRNLAGTKLEWWRKYEKGLSYLRSGRRP